MTSTPKELAAAQAILAGKAVPDSGTGTGQATPRATVAGEDAALPSAGQSSRITAPATPRDATAALRDLAVAMPTYDREDRATAQRILARPTDLSGDPEPFGVGKYAVDADVRHHCFTNVCLHWVMGAPGTADAVDPTDSDSDGVPDWVQLTGDTLDQVWNAEIGDLGYRPPMPDGGTVDKADNPDDRLDVYLSDLEPAGLYGYCTPEIDPAADRTYSTGYCVLDRDFVYAGSPSKPVADLKATAAHEFFHAVQFGYDYAEDLWLMEGSAAWIEDVVYDSLNSNRPWLRSSPVRYPWLPLDFAAPETEQYPMFIPYGSWSFLQYLTERVAHTPNVVRRIWEYADASPGRISNDPWAITATDRALRTYNSTFRKAFSGYATGNRTPGRTYSEGSAWPKPETAKVFTLKASRPSPGAWWVESPHLSAQTFRYKADTSLTGKRRLRIAVDMAAPKTMPFASVLVFERGTGKVRVRSVSLDSDGKGGTTVPFSRRDVSYVEVVLGNGSTRMKCSQGTWLACEGTPLDDPRRANITVKAIRG